MDKLSNTLQVRNLGLGGFGANGSQRCLNRQVAFLRAVGILPERRWIQKPKPRLNWYLERVKYFLRLRKDYFYFFYSYKRILADFTRAHCPGLCREASCGAYRFIEGTYGTDSTGVLRNGSLATSILIILLLFIQSNSAIFCPGPLRGDPNSSFFGVSWVHPFFSLSSCFFNT